jgi:acetyl esterase
LPRRCAPATYNLVMLTSQASAFLAEARALQLPPIWEVPIEQTRADLDRGADALFGQAPGVAAIEDQTAAGVPVRIYRPTEAPTAGALVYLHGGGWAVGSLQSHDRLCRALAAHSGQTVLSAGYRLAPEHPFPAAINDAWSVTRWAAQRWERIAVGGDSAGGQLAASVALRARDAGLDLRLQVLIYPVANHAFDTASYSAFNDLGALTQAEMRWFWQTYLSGPQRLPVADHSPLQATSFSGLAPALVITAEYDPLRDEGEAYADCLRTAGVETVHRRYAGMFHGFIRMPSRLDEASAAIAEVADAVRAACGSHRDAA